MIVALGDVEIAGPIELDFVRHVQRRVDGRPAIAVVAGAAAAGDRREAARFQIQPADPLIAEVTEIQRAVWSDDHAVRIVDLLIRVAGRAGAGKRRDRGRTPCDHQH